MRVRIYDVDAEGSETFRATCELRDCFPVDDDYYNAMSELTRSGRYWGGGGAAPLVLLFRIT